MEHRLLHMNGETPSAVPPPPPESREATEKPSEACSASLQQSVDLAERYPTANPEDAAAVARQTIATLQQDRND